MGIFDFLTGSNQTKQQSSTVVDDSNVDVTSLTNKAGASSKQTGTVSDVLQTKSQLDAGTKDELTQFLTSLVNDAGGAGDTTAVDFAKTFSDRAGGADTAIADSIAQVISAARAKGEEALGRRNTAIASQAGSSLNSVVQQLGIEGRADLETQLAGQEGQLQLQGRGLATNEFGTASKSLTDALSSLQSTSESQVSGISDIANVLKGADATTSVSTEQQTTEQQVNQLVEALQSLTKGKTIRSTDQSGTATDSGSILDIFSALKPQGLGQ